MIIYHGTNTENGIAIARCGAILSPYERELLFLQEHFPNQKTINNTSLEEWALQLASSTYSESEHEARVYSLSITSDLNASKSYATRNEHRKGGIILGIEMDDAIVTSLPKHYGNDAIRYVRNRLSLENLKEIHLSPTAARFEELIHNAFEKYAPRYLKIQKK